MENTITINIDKSEALDQAAITGQLPSLQLMAKDNEIYILLGGEFKLLKNEKSLLVNEVALTISSFQSNDEQDYKQNYLYFDAVRPQQADNLLQDNYENVDFDQLLGESVLQETTHDPLDFLYQGDHLTQEK